MAGVPLPGFVLGSPDLNSLPRPRCINSHLNYLRFYYLICTMFPISTTVLNTFDTEIELFTFCFLIQNYLQIGYNLSEIQNIFFALQGHHAGRYQ